MKRLLIPMVTAFFLAGCGNDEVYTLYRAGVGLPDLRIHVATFDSDDSRDSNFKTYNLDNCRLAANLFQSQLNVTTKYWCEKGRYKK